MDGVILNANCLVALKAMPDRCVDMCLTSPPYWALRDYGTEGQIWDGDAACQHQWADTNTRMHNGRGDAQKGAKYSEQEPIPDRLISYASCHKCGAWKGPLGLEPTPELYIKHLCDIFDEVKRVLKPIGTCWVNLGDTHAGKSLCQIPSRFAIEMTERGWIVGNEIIWHKPNCMPSNVKDRFSGDFEKIFLFAKTKKYHFEQQFEPLVGSGRSRAEYGRNGDDAERLGERFCKPRGRNKRCVWSIRTRPFKGTHFATFPAELCDTPIKAGCPVNGIVLDIFAGAGTTLLVAKKLGRKYIGCELNPEYCRMIEERLAGDTPLPPLASTPQESVTRSGSSE
jgi:site-specific DNA-methyltransferase (adenine-specific)